MDAEPPILPVVHSPVRRRHDGAAPDNVSDIGTRLRAHRRAANITLRQVAEKSGLTARSSDFSRRTTTAGTVSSSAERSGAC